MITDAIRQQLVADAPAWARWWTQGVSGAGYFWEHRPVADLLAGAWKSAPECYLCKCLTRRHDLNLSGAYWPDLLIEIPQQQPGLFEV